MRTLALALLTMGLAIGCDPAPEAAPVGSEREAPATAADPQAAATTPEPEPEPEPESLETQAEALVETMEALAEIHAANANDCAGLAASLKSFATEHRVQLDAQTPEQHAWIDGHEATRSRLRRAMGAVMTGSMTCRDDAGVKAFYASLEPG